MTPRNLKMTNKGVREQAVRTTTAQVTPFELRPSEQYTNDEARFTCYRVKVAYSRVGQQESPVE